MFVGLVHGLGFANTLRFILAQDQSLGWALFGFNVGLEAGQVIIVAAILLLSQLLVQVLKVPRREWVLFVSAAVFGLSLQMALERWPAKAETETSAGDASLPGGPNAPAVFASTQYDGAYK